MERRGWRRGEEGGTRTPKAFPGIPRRARITHKFTEQGGAIPPNLLTLGNNDANGIRTLDFRLWTSPAAPPGPLPGPTPRVLHEVSSQSAGNSWSLTIPAIVRHVASRHQPSTLNYQPPCRPGPVCRQLHDWRSRRTPGPKMDRDRTCPRLPRRRSLPL